MKIGDAIDNLGVEIDLESNEIIVDVLVCVRTVDAEGEGFRYVWGDNTNMVVRRGMLETALTMEKSGLQTSLEFVIGNDE